MSPATGLALTGMNFVVYSKGMTGTKFKKQNQNGPIYTCIVRDYPSFVDSCNFTNKANSNTFKVEMHTRQNYAILAALAKAKLICQKKRFRPGNRAEVFIWENFHSGCRDLGCRNRDLGNRAGPPADEHIDKTGPARSTGLI